MNKKKDQKERPSNESRNNNRFNNKIKRLRNPKIYR